MLTYEARFGMPLIVGTSAAYLLWLMLLFRREYGKLLTVSVASGALTLHLWALIQNGGFVLLAALSWISFSMAAMSLVGLVQVRWRITSVIAAAFGVVGSALLLWARPASRALPWTTELHAALALAAFATLLLGSALAVVMLWQERALKTHRSARGRWMPALASTEQMHFTLIWIGFALLSLTLISGVLFISDWFAQHLVHKTVLTLAAWCLFAALLWGRYRRGLRGTQAARLSLIGMGMLILAFLGSKLVLEVLLKRTVA
jgi:ABC-type uncharacterized transport system permease subunit